MKISTMFRAVLLTAVFASVQANAGVIPVSLQVSEKGILTGAKNVNVGGTLYDVAFADGNCNSLFSSCSVTAFTFTTSAAAGVAAQALLDQVFVDGPLGQFDSTTNKITGCTSTLLCQSYIPYSLSGTNSFNFRIASNASSTNQSAIDGLGAGNTGRGSNLGTNTSANFALFTLSPVEVAEVPEPGSIALLGLAAAGLGLARRRKTKV